MRAQVVRTFNDYAVLEEIGRGGFATTYRTVDQRSGQTLALKVYTSGSADLLSAVASELAKLKDIDEPTLVRYHDAGTRGDQLFVSMEFVDGPSLKNLLVRHVDNFQSNAGDRTFGARTTDEIEEFVRFYRIPQLATDAYFAWALGVANDIVDGVRVLHAHGLIHADLKLSNVLLYGDDRVRAKLTDYSVDNVVAQKDRMHSEASAHTLAAFSVAYAHPDMIQGKQAAPYMDVYSMGVLLGELFLLPVDPGSDWIGRWAAGMRWLKPGGLWENGAAHQRIARSRLASVRKAATSIKSAQKDLSLDLLWGGVSDAIGTAPTPQAKRHRVLPHSC